MKPKNTDFIRYSGRYPFHTLLKEGQAFYFPLREIQKVRVAACHYRNTYGGDFAVRKIKGRGMCYRLTQSEIDDKLRRSIESLNRNLTRAITE